MHRTRTERLDNEYEMLIGELFKGSDEHGKENIFNGESGGDMDSGVTCV